MLSFDSTFQDDDMLKSDSEAFASGHITTSRDCTVSRLKSLIEQRRRSVTYRRMLSERERLPVHQHRKEVLDAFRCHNVFIVAGETGSGKSTQVPQLILEVRAGVSYVGGL